MVAARTGLRAIGGCAALQMAGAMDATPDSAVERGLLERARRGDADAFGALVEPHQRQLFNLALRLIGDRDLAADLTQDALLRAYLALPRFRGEARVGTWLARITHNACLDALRWRSRHPQQSLDDGAPGTGAALRQSLADTTPGPEAEVLRRESEGRLLRSLDTLDPEFRAAVVLRDIQGMSYEEAAAVAGVPVGTLKSRLHRARTRLRELLAPGGVVDHGEAR